MTAQEDHDQRLKEAVKSKFSDAIDLLLPTWVPLFDYSKIEWIEQEIFPDPPRGERREIDILAKLPTVKPVTGSAEEPPAQECLGLVHVEVEGWESIAVMRRRMRDYRHHLRRKFQLPVLPLCIYLQVGMQGIGWDQDEETFFGEVINVFRYRYMGLPALDGVEYIQGSNLLGVALASMMKIPEPAKAKAKADAMQKIAGSDEPEMRKYLLCECVNTYLPLEEPQMEEYEKILITQPYQGVRKYGKTWFEQGYEKGEVKGKVEGELTGERKLIRKQLEHRFGPLSEQAKQRLEVCTETELLDLAEKILTASSLDQLGLEE